MSAPAAADILPRVKKQLKEGWLFACLLLAPSNTRAHILYELLPADSSIMEANSYMNLGYWKDSPEDFQRAGDALVRLLGETAGLCSSDRVLDVGFGFGDQDLYWNEHFSPKEIIGLNVTKVQVDVARRRMAARGLSERIDLRLGSATEVPFDADSFDKVLALECALHFHTRERFFQEAFRVLRPGGRLALTDVIPSPQEEAQSLRGKIADRITQSFMQVCRENLYDRHVYKMKLEKAGFQNVKVASIRDDVLAPFSRYLLARMNDREMSSRLGAPTRIVLTHMAKAVVAGSSGNTMTDYVLAFGDKPR